MDGTLFSVGIGIALASCVSLFWYLVHRLLGYREARRRPKPVAKARIVRFVVIPIRCCVCGNPMADGDLALAFDDGRFTHGRCALTLNEVLVEHSDKYNELDRLLEEDKKKADG